MFEPIKWEVVGDVANNDFKPLVDQILDSGKSCNIDGRAGTGKSTLIQMIQTELDERGIQYISVAPTNKACRIIKGKTIHRFIASFKLTAFKASNIKYIFIDEISMMCEIFYKFFITLKRACPEIKYIIAGDFEQLLPVKDRVNCDYKNSIALHELSDGVRFQLSKCRRSDDRLFNMLQPKNIGKITVNDFGKEMTKTHI